MLRRTKSRYESYTFNAVFNEKAIYKTYRKYEMKRLQLVLLLLSYEYQKHSNKLVSVNALGRYAPCKLVTVGRIITVLRDKGLLEQVKPKYERKIKSGVCANKFYNVTPKGKFIVDAFNIEVGFNIKQFKEAVKYKPIKPDTLKYYDSLGIMHKQRKKE